MSAVRPSPVSRAQIRQVSRSPLLKPVFAGSSISRNAIDTGVLSSDVTGNLHGTHLRRIHQSDPCLVDAPVAHASLAEQSLENNSGPRRRLFDHTCLPQIKGDFRIQKMPSKFNPTGNRLLYKQKGKSTTANRVENSSIAPHAASLSNKNVKKSLRCRTDGAMATRSSTRVPISPGSQRSQDSGFSDSDSQPDERRIAKAVPVKLQNKVSVHDASRHLQHTRGFLSASSVNLTMTSHDQSYSAKSSEIKRLKTRAGHTPKQKRFAKSRLQVLTDRQAEDNDGTSNSFNGPLTSSPVCSSHTLQCSAVERELDLILERVEQADILNQVGQHEQSHNNETAIEFQPSCIEMKENISHLPISSPTSNGKSQSGKVDSFYRRLAGDTRSLRLEKRQRPTENSVICVAQIGSAPARHWLNEQLSQVENECMNMLQSKSVISDMSHLLALSARHARTNVREIQLKAKLVSKEFNTLFKELEHVAFEEVPAIVSSIDKAINNFIKDCPTSQTEKSICKYREDNMKKLKSLIGKMSVYVNSCNLIDRTLRIEDLMQVLNSLAQAFNHLVDWMLSEEVKVLLSALSPGNDILCLKLALRSVTSVALDGARLCRILVSKGAVDALLDIVRGDCRQLRSQTLRALSTICCVSQGVKAFEVREGLQLITSILTDPLSTEEQRSECAGIIAQVTAPSNDTVYAPQVISEHAEAIVRELTGLAATTDSAESLLMASAALANLTFLNIGAVRLLQHNGSAGVLCAALSANSHCSMFVKDQTATVLANMASIVECHADLLRGGALDTLLALLHVGVSGVDAATAAAAERVLQKTAIALSRLCVSRAVSQRAVGAGALHRLVQLCREPGERARADGVLVACLTTLRKIAAAVGLQPLRDLHALDLVEPRLLESFLVCSARSESCL